MCVAGFAIAIASLYQEAGTYPLERLEHVRVLDRMDDANFRLAVQDPDTHQWNDFSARFCDSFKVTSQAVPGTMFTYLKYYDNDRKHCFDVAPHNTGYALLRGEKNVPIIALQR